MTAKPPDHDIVCIGCGYDLRGYEHYDVCPECGKPIKLSVPAAVREGALRTRERWPYVVTFVLGLALSFVHFGLWFTAPSVAAWFSCTPVPMAIAGAVTWKLSQRRPESWALLGVWATAGAIPFALLMFGTSYHVMFIVTPVAFSCFAGAFLGRQTSDKIERFRGGDAR